MGYTTQKLDRIPLYDVEYLQTSGGTVTGPISGVTPTLASHLATKQYVDNIAAGVPVDLGFTDVTQHNVIGAPTHIDSLEKIYNHLYSSGIMHGCDLTDNGNGTVNISTGNATLRAAGSTGHDTLYSVEVPAKVNLALTDNATNYVYVSYNDGTTIQILATTSPTTINMIDKIPAYVIVREGNILTYIDVREQNVDHIAKNQLKDFYTDTFRRRNGGCIVSDAGTRHLHVTAGSFYFQLNEYATPALDTSVSGTFEYYKHVSGTWAITNASQIDNQYYDNGTDLVLLSNNKYSAHWIYIVVGNSPRYAVVYGNAEYNTASAATAAPLPTTVPPSLTGLGVLIGRAIIQKGATELDSVATTFGTSLPTAAGVDIHNDLGGLQGGTANEYYHLTSSQHTGLTGGSNTTLHSHDYDKYTSWSAKDHDGTTYTVTSGDTLWFKEGTGIDVSFTADDELAITNTAPNVTTNLSYTRDATTLTVVSSDGTNAILPTATATLAGILTSSLYTTLSGFDTLATIDTVGQSFSLSTSKDLGAPLGITTTALNVLYSSFDVIHTSDARDASINFDNGAFYVDTKSLSTNKRVISRTDNARVTASIMDDGANSNAFMTLESGKFEVWTNPTSLTGDGISKAFEVTQTSITPYRTFKIPYLYNMEVHSDQHIGFGDTGAYIKSGASGTMYVHEKLKVGTTAPITMDGSTGVIDASVYKQNGVLLSEMFSGIAAISTYGANTCEVINVNAGFQSKAYATSDPNNHYTLRFHSEWSISDTILRDDGLKTTYAEQVFNYAGQYLTVTDDYNNETAEGKSTIDQQNTGRLYSLDSTTATERLFQHRFEKDNITFSFGVGPANFNTAELIRFEKTGITATQDITAPRLVSNVATGTAPLAVTSTTVVTNLNADLLDGLHASSFAASIHSHSYVSEGGTTFVGTYPIAVRTAANVFYSHPSMTFNGATNTLTAPIFSGDLSGNAATATNADLLDGQHGSYYQPASTAITTSNIGNQSVSSASNIDGIPFRNGNYTNSTAPDSITGNGTGYVGQLNILGQTDGALYSQAYDETWVHQIFGDYRTGRIAVRGRNNGTWQPWKEVACTDSSISGNAATATKLSNTRSTWSASGAIDNVVGQLAWKNYGENHTIFDASGSLTPTGVYTSNTNPDVPWTGTYPTLMGYNGTSTYGVRVDVSARSESCTGNAATASNADLLDGIPASSFLRSDVSDSVAAGRKISYYSYNDINSGTGDQASLEVFNGTVGADAFMQFHVGGDYAIYFGLDGGTNKLSVGGWSMGASSYAIYHEGNKPTPEALGALSPTHIEVFPITINTGSNIQTSLNTIWKPTDTNEFGDTWHSTNPCQNACKLKFRLEGTSCHAMIGISADIPTSTSTYEMIDYAWYMTDDAQPHIYENGIYRGPFGTSAGDGDIFEIINDGAFIRYYQNGILCRSVDISDYTDFYVVGDFHSNLKIQILEWETLPYQIGFDDIYINDHIISTDDTDTYMHFSAADQWRVVTGGSERFKVTNSGVTISSGVVNFHTGQTRDKYRLWDDSNYTIGFKSGYTFGGLVNDYAMSFQMNNQSTRGFWWGDAAHTDAQGAMALTTDGKLTVATAVRIGYGESDTTVPIGGLHVKGNHTYVGNYGYSTLVLEESSGHPGINWRHGNYNWLNKIDAGNHSLEWCYSSNASAPGVGTYAKYMDLGANGVLTLGSAADYALTISSSNSAKILLEGATDPYIRFKEGTTEKAYIQWSSAGCLMLANQEDSSIFRIGDSIGDYGSCSIDGGATNGWEGYSIGGRVVFMHNNGIEAGIFDDVNNNWLIYAVLGGTTRLYYAGDTKLATTNTGVSITGTITESSARKYKENIEPLEDCLETVLKLEPVKYVRKADETKTLEIGLIADDVEKIRPEYVKYEDGEVDSISYQRIVADLIGAIKEQQKMIEKLEARIETLEKDK
jgi:hypothetical protein